VPRRSIAQQRDFFATQLAGWYRAGLDDLRNAPGARFYPRVADFAQAWLDAEAQALSGPGGTA
jgi:TorA maturation chaperone TorD